jgi:hypothetical protein
VAATVKISQMNVWPTSLAARALHFNAVIFYGSLRLGSCNWITVQEFLCAVGFAPFVHVNAGHVILKGTTEQSVHRTVRSYQH